MTKKLASTKSLAAKPVATKKRIAAKAVAAKKRVASKPTPVRIAGARPLPRHIQTPAANARALESATMRLASRRLRDLLPVKIETKRLVLRSPIRGDVPALVKHADNIKIASMLSRLPHPYTRADAIGFVEIIAQRADERPYAITLDGVLIGVIGFTFTLEQPPELGYWLGESYWGQGIASEAAVALLEAARATGAFPMVRARALAENAASLNLLEKVGFRRISEKVDDCGNHKNRKIVSLLKELRR